MNTRSLTFGLAPDARAYRWSPPVETQTIALPAVYGLLIVVGLVGGLGDILLLKWARSQLIGWLVAAAVVWACALALLGHFLRWEHFTFGTAIVVATVVHVALDVGFDAVFNEVRLNRTEWLGLVLALVAVVLLEAGRGGDIRMERKGSQPRALKSFEAMAKSNPEPMR
jgi:hypothetical protein